MPAIRLAAAVASAALLFTGVAEAAGGTAAGPAGRTGDGALPAGQAIPGDTPPLGLPAARENVELVSKLELKGRFGDVRPGQIADVSAKGDYAYVNSWRDEVAGTCARGGVFVVDIRDPAAPREVGFIPSLPGSYPGEGSQVVTLDTPAFRGDLLTINNEACTTSGTRATRAGGISLIDVTDPLNPVKLADGFGDATPPAVTPGVKDRPEHFVHSAFTWQDGNRAYTVMVDNQELEDVDIVDITNPRAPELINELHLVDADNPLIGGSAYGDRILLHDMVVKEIGGVQTMLLSYWDGGYVKMNFDDPRNPFVIAESDFAATDPLFPSASPPEGNAHQAEFSADDRYVVAADEDFAPFRIVAEVTTGPAPGRYDIKESSSPGVRQIVDFDDRSLGGDAAVYVGTGCTIDPIATPPAGDGDAATERIAVMERGGCPFAEKVANADAAGWDGYVIFNNADRPDGDPLINATVQPATLSGVYMRRADALPALFGRTDGSTPPKGTAAQPFRARAAFDGWGYMHLLDARTMTELDQYAVTEARDERLATGFGELSVHETANDDATSLSYVSYYRAGFRVLQFGDGRLREVGKFIDARGNNFWGVHSMRDRSGRRIVLASDRDYGLYVLRYTGPGAAADTVPAAAASAPAGGGVPATGARPGSSGGSSTGSSGGGPPRVGLLAISGNSIRLSRAGFALIRVGCPAGAVRSCKGTVRLASGKRALGTKRFSVAAGRKATVKVRLASAGRRILGRRKSLRVQVTAGTTDEVGTRLSNTRRITVRPASGR